MSMCLQSYHNAFMYAFIFRRWLLLFLAQILFSLSLLLRLSLFLPTTLPLSLFLPAPLIVQHVYAWRRMMALFSHFILSNAEILLFLWDNQERENETDCAFKRTKKLNDASNQINVLLCIQHKISYYVHIDNTESNGFSHHPTDTLINITPNRVQFIILYHTVHETFNKIWLKLQMFQFGVCAWHRHPTSIISIKLNAWNMLLFLPSYSFGIKYDFICLNL